MSAVASPLSSVVPSPSPSAGGRLAPSRDQSASKQSGRGTTLAFSEKSALSRQSRHRGDDDDDNDSIHPEKNPFKMPPENEIFVLRDKERQKKKAERVRQRNLHVHEKLTYASRVNAKAADMRREALKDMEEYELPAEDGDQAVTVKDDPDFMLSVTKDRRVEKEPLNEYITKKREMFLVQYSLGVKRDEMRKLEEIAQAEEKKLELAEQYLEEDAAMFDEFLKENDKNSVEAIKVAEAETKLKLEKVADIKKINAHMMLLKSEISKNEETLKEYMLYKRFLEALTPKEWLQDKKAKRQQRRIEKLRARGIEPSPPKGKKKGDSNASSDGKSSRGGTRESHRSGMKSSQSQSRSAASKRTGTASSKESVDQQPSYTSMEDDSDEDSDEEQELYFTDPQQLLHIFSELEEQNLTLIQNSQETEETLEEIKQTMITTSDKMSRETEVLKQQIDIMKSSIEREKIKAADLEVRAKMFSFGEFKSEDQEKMLSSLNRKVEEVYRNCIGDNEANISTLQMLTNIENRLEELFEAIENMPVEKVEAAEKAKEKERRLRARQEKLEQQRLHQEERVRRALERAQAEPKKKTGKPLVFRSAPPQIKKTEDLADLQANKEEEEMQYYFT